MRINEDRPISWNPTLALILSLICAGSLFRQLANRPFLCGADGYYYALQADTWARTGQVKIPDSSVIPRVMGLIQRTGVRTETAVRLGWSGLVLLAWLAFIPLILKVPSTALRWLMFTWVLASPSLVFNAIEFPRMFLAFATMPLWFAVLRTWSPIGAFVVAWGTLLLHRGITPFAMAFSLSLLAIRPLSRRHWLFGITFLLAVVLSGLALKDHLRWVDFSRITILRDAPGLWILIHRSSLPLSIKVELVGSLVLALILAWRAISVKNRSLGWMSIAFLLPALIPMNSSEIFGASERWAVIYPVVIIALTAFELGINDSDRKSPHILSRFSLIIFSAVAAIFVTTSRLLTYAHPLRLDPDYSAYERLVKDLTNQDIPMLIAHRGLNFYYKYRLKRESFPFEPEASWDRTHIWRMTYRITPAEMNYYLPENCRFGTGRVQASSVPDYLLIREDCWDVFRDKVRGIDDDDLHSRVFESWQNPSQKRPAFLYAKHSKDPVTEFPATE